MPPLTCPDLVERLADALAAAQTDARRWAHIAHKLLYTPKSRCRLCGGTPEAHTAACLYRQAVEG